MSPNVRVKDCNENNDIWWNSINLDMTWSTKYQVIYVANIKWTLIFQLLVKVWKSNHVSLNPWNAALEVSDLNEKLQSGLFGGGGQNSLSQLWTNTSLSPNLVIHSPLLLLQTLFRKNSAEQLFVLSMCSKMSWIVHLSQRLDRFLGRRVATW